MEDIIIIVSQQTVKVDLNGFEGETREERLDTLKSYIEEDHLEVASWCVESPYNFLMIDPAVTTTEEETEE